MKQNSSLINIQKVPKNPPWGKNFIGKNPIWPPNSAESQCNIVLIDGPSAPTTQFSDKCVNYH